MRIKVQLTSLAKPTAYLLFIIVFCSFCLSVSGQDWAGLSNLQKQLRASHPDTGRVNILLKLAEFEILKPGEFKKDLDSASVYIQDAEQLNRTLKSTDATSYITIEQSFLAREHNDMKTGRILIEKAIQQLVNKNNNYLLGKAYMGLSEYYDRANPQELKKKIQYVQLAASKYASAGYIAEEAFCYQYIGDLTDEMALADSSLKKALLLYKSVNYKKLQGLYDLFAQGDIVKNNFKSALNNDLIALNIAQQQHDSSGTLVEIENHIGIIYAQTGDKQNQFKFFKMAIDAARLNKDTGAVTTLSLNLTDSYLRFGSPVEAEKLLNSLHKYDLRRFGKFNQFLFYECTLKTYTALARLDRAKQVIPELIPILKTDEIANWQKSDIYVALINFYLASREYDNAREYLLLNDKIIKNFPSLIYPEINNSLWLRLDTAQHDYKSATYHSMKVTQLSDSVFNIKKAKEFQDLQVKYETKAKESQISFLNRQSVLEAQNLRQANIVKDYTIAGCVLLVIIAGLLYRQNFLKQRSSKIISNKNSQLQHLLTEKEWLLKEVHHRVKNNLHTVICLLESQSAYLENDALKAIENSRHRIYAMSLIHQKLYQSDDIKVIDMDLYLAEFVQYLKESFGSCEHINVVLRAESMKLGAAQAIPIGLIINEAVNNSFKYAFPNQMPGEIEIELKRIGDEIYLSITDDGVGFKQQPDQELNSLGLELIKGLTLDLHGTLSINSDNGTSISIRFATDGVNIPAEEEVSYA